MDSIKKLTEQFRRIRQKFERSDKVSVNGRLQLSIYSDGKLYREEGQNLVVTLGRENLAKLLAGDPAGTAIVDFKAGTSGAAVTAGDTAITSPFTKAITSATYPAPGAVQFNFSIELTEANGMTIQEFGLFDDSGNLFARKTWAPIVKNNTIRIVGAWVVSF